ncbi:hypothetical protein ABIC01_008806 [Bradyrhizobium sp. RT4b]
MNSRALRSVTPRGLSSSDRIAAKPRRLPWLGDQALRENRQATVAVFSCSRPSRCGRGAFKRTTRPRGESWRGPVLFEPARHRRRRPVRDLDPVARPRPTAPFAVLGNDPSRFMRQAASSRSGPIAPGSKGATKMPWAAGVAACRVRPCARIAAARERRRRQQRISSGSRWRDRLRTVCGLIPMKLFVPAEIVHGAKFSFRRIGIWPILFAHGPQKTLRSSRRWPGITAAKR